MGEPRPTGRSTPDHRLGGPRQLPLRGASAFALGLALSGSLFAQPPGHLGGQFQVNDYTTGNQVVPHVGVAPDGSFVVVWTSEGSPGTDNNGTSIQGRRFTAGGAPLGPQFQVNTYTFSGQDGARVALGPGGEFLVVWHSSRSGPYGADNDSSIEAQRFEANGTPAGSEFTVNSYTTSGQGVPSLAATPAGEFVVVWLSWGSPGNDQSGTSIQARRFAQNGTPLGGQFQVNTYTTDLQGSPRVGAGPDGGFVVVWTSEGSPGSDSDGKSIQGRRLAADGSPLGDQFQVNSSTTGFQNSADVAIAGDGSFLVVWGSHPGTGSSVYDVHAQRFSAVATPAGPELRVNSYTTHSQSLASVAATPGGFVVVWRSFGSVGPDPSVSIEGRRLDAVGSFVGGEFLLNTYTAGTQTFPSVAAAPEGVATVVWESNGSAGTDQSLASIQGQRLSDGLFLDGFESADTSAWSSTEP